MRRDAVRDSLRYSFKDGVFFSLMFGFGELFLVPYCIALNGTSRTVAFLATLPGFVGALSQLYSTEAIEKFKSRRAIINFCILAQALMWLPIILFPYLFGSALSLLVFFVVAYAALGAFCFPAWSSMMSEYVPQSARGKYFGWRNKTLGLVVVASNLFGGFVLWGFGRGQIAGFSVIFGIAFVSRILSWYFLAKMYDPPYRHTPEARFTFFDFVRRIRHSNFARFVFIAGGMMLAVNVAGPFFSIYMLRELNFSYLTYTVITLSATLTTLVMMERWGRHADIVGNVRVMRTCALFLPVIPMLWLVSHNVFYLIAIQVFSGFFWAGFNMSVSNFIYDAVTPAKRSRCISYFNIINGTSLFLGALLGGYLAQKLPMIKGHRLLSLFLLSGLLRITPALFTQVIKEVRGVRDVKHAELFYSVFGLKKIVTPEAD